MVPQPTFGPTGFIAPLESAILAGVTSDINEAFGGNLNPALTTPQGQLATSETAIIGNVNDTFVYLTNQVDPAYAVGRMQDAIARIYFLERNPSQPTVLQIQCNGLTGLLIPAGALIVDGSNNIYVSTDSGTIGTSGNVVLPFANIIAGPIAAPEEDDVSIYQAIPGWDSVECLSDVLGNNTETPSQFEARRAASVAVNSLGSLPSVQGAVLSVPGVLDAYCSENDLGEPATVGGVTLNPNSIYIAVTGGEAQAIGQAIWSKKMPGCAYNGNTTVTVQDTNSGYNPPFPSYSVTFERPASLAILFAIDMVNGPQVPANAVTLIQNAIVGAFAGLDGGLRARIGSQLLASRYYSAIAALGSWAQIILIQVGSNNTASATLVGSISGSNLTVTAVPTGALAVGQTLSDASGDLIEGTTIESQTSGTPGGIGVYVVSNSQTVGSESMTSAVANQNLVDVNINQEPVTSAPYIQVTFT
jgi:hypothetical protein